MASVKSDPAAARCPSFNAHARPSHIRFRIVGKLRQMTAGVFHSGLAPTRTQVDLSPFALNFRYGREPVGLVQIGQGLIKFSSQDQ
jgi:hypothetical protein